MKTNKQIDKEIGETVNNSVSNATFFVLFNAMLYAIGYNMYPTSTLMEFHTFAVGVGAGALIIAMRVKRLRSKKEAT